MALVTIAGYPCSGKNKRAHQLRDLLVSKFNEPAYDGPRLKVVILSDEILNIQRDVYDDSRAEKTARGIVFAVVQRTLSINTILILDGLNYIKGFRYQLYCAARESKLRVITIYTAATAGLCREWNTRDGQRYNPETLDHLILRFEEPSSMARWDSPLFTIFWTEPGIPGEDLWKVITTGAIKPPNSGTLAVAKNPTDALHILEQTTSTVISAILGSESASSSSGGLTPLSVGFVKVSILLPPRKIAISELQRLKRQFVLIHKKAITLGSTEKGIVDWDERRIAEKFVSYVQDNLVAC